MVIIIGHIGCGSYAHFFPGHSTTSTWTIGNTPKDTVTNGIDFYIAPDPCQRKSKIYPSIYKTTRMPWLFDYDEPWKAPVHYPAALMTIKPTNQSMHFLHQLTIKQPIARSGFRRGQRR